MAYCDSCIYYYMNGGKCNPQHYCDGEDDECPYTPFHYVFNRPNDDTYIKLKSYIDTITRYYKMATELIDDMNIGGGYALDCMRINIHNLEQEYNADRLKEFLDMSR